MCHNIFCKYDCTSETINTKTLTSFSARKDSVSLVLNLVSHLAAANSLSDVVILVNWERFFSHRMSLFVAVVSFYCDVKTSFDVDNFPLCCCMRFRLCYAVFVQTDRSNNIPVIKTKIVRLLVCLENSIFK